VALAVLHLSSPPLPSTALPGATPSPLSAPGARLIPFSTAGPIATPSSPLATSGPHGWVFFHEPLKLHHPTLRHQSGMDRVGTSREITRVVFSLICSLLYLINSLSFACPFVLLRLEKPKQAEKKLGYRIQRTLLIDYRCERSPHQQTSRLCRNEFGHRCLAVHVLVISHRKRAADQTHRLCCTRGLPNTR
jgi:hypothetical protein